MKATAISWPTHSLPQTRVPASPADSTAVTTADSVAFEHAGSCAANTLAEATPEWSTWTPFQPQYTDGVQPLYRTVTDAAAVFGPTSVSIPAQPYTPSEAHPLTTNFVFQGFVLLLAAIYIMLLYHHLGNAALLLSRIARLHTTGNRLLDDPGGNGFSRFLSIAAITGLLFVGVAVVKACDLLLPPDIIPTIPTLAVAAIGALAILTCLAIAVYQSLTVYLAGSVVLARPIAAQLMYLKRIYFVLFALVTTPALLLFALCPPGEGKVWFYVIVVQLVITTILYLKESLNLFLSKKVSILHWFLYLCAVEIFPISLLWLAAVR